ncbi:hypothetical protein JGH11_09455 [Dysgonomonas sp. Marseille-P4677]|uniref:hypothetical protein n=1 Tax=Dysgonomonas sp. Marseille-P4677 TaxID=2364790 RepID=UPI0019145340|nr:hypothetical protein [Dysgonomonas sp. Marseille-P4677]MBK5721093.1 hypothetical protein [Dysgonomonas sp. Marseille-P4677]
MDELLTVKTSDFEANLAIAKSYLIDNGIDCVVNSGYISISQPDSGSATLQVRSGDFDRAKELLIKGGFSKREDFV